MRTYFALKLIAARGLGDLAELAYAFIPSGRKYEFCTRTRTPSRPPTAISPFSPLSAEAQKNDGNQQDYLDSMSDEEALLACRAYLQRKNRLGWPEHERRKRRARQAFANRSSRYAAAGFFWEDPSELKYMTNRPPHLQDPFLEEPMEEEEDDDDRSEDDASSARHQRVVFDELHSVTDEEGMSGVRDRGGEFTTFPVVPPEERLRRSEAAKKTWSDPEWKARWYEKRWGGSKRKRTPEQRKRDRVSERVKALPPDLIGSPELASMSEAEITEAIHTYVVSNRRRSESHRRKRTADQASSASLESKPLIQTFGSEEAMREAQRTRSKRSTNAYKTRLKNQQDLASKPRRRKRATDHAATSNDPRDAALRMQLDLDGSQLPSMEDVKLLLEPRKLGGRKELLRRILNEHFDLRGKCIPSVEGEKLLFVTQCPIDELGSFVLSKMKEKR